MVDFRVMMRDLQDMGFLQIVLPFILVFAIVFAILEKSKLLGQDDDNNPRSNINVIVSLVMGFTFVIPSVTGLYPHRYDPVRIISEALPNVGLLVIGIVMFLLLLGIFNISLNTKQNKSLGTVVVFLSVISVFVIFLAASGVFGIGIDLPRWLWFVYNPQFTTLLVAVLVFGIIIWGVTYKKATPEDKEKQKDWGFDLIKK